MSKQLRVEPGSAGVPEPGTPGRLRTRLRDKVIVRIARRREDQLLLMPLTAAPPLLADRIAKRVTRRAEDEMAHDRRLAGMLSNLAADPNAADKQEEAFDKAQDTFRDRLVQLIAQQKISGAGGGALTAMSAADAGAAAPNAAHPTMPIQNFFIVVPLSVQSPIRRTA